MAFNSQQKYDMQPLVEINTTPLVDVMLVLLVIFIITMPLLPQAMKVDLPSKNTDPASQQSTVIKLQLDRNGMIFINDDSVTESDVSSRLQLLGKHRDTTELRLYVDKHTPYEYLANVMAKAHSAGLTKMAFMTQPE